MARVILTPRVDGGKALEVEDGPAHLTPALVGQLLGAMACALVDPFELLVPDPDEEDDGG